MEPAHDVIEWETGRGDRLVLRSNRVVYKLRRDTQVWVPYHVVPEEMTMGSYCCFIRAIKRARERSMRWTDARVF